MQSYYRNAAARRTDPASASDAWGVALYDEGSLAELPDSATELSMGCGNPHLLADLHDGEVVLDLGSGGGIDVILSAKRVAPNGRAYGIDFLEEMIEISQANAAEAGVTNVDFLHGYIEDVPLPDSSVDVVISNCVICLAPDKRPVFEEMARVLRPGGRIAITDVLAYEAPTADDSRGGDWSECGSGGLDAEAYTGLMTEAGLADVVVTHTHETGPGLYSAIVRARRP